jgi:hypothetical protein
MNFTELVRLSNQLENLTVTDIQQDAGLRFDLLKHKSDVPLADIPTNFYQDLADKNQVLQKAFGDLEQAVHDLKLEVQRRVEIEGRSWLQRSYTLYEQQIDSRDSQKPEAVGYHRNKPIKLDAETEKLFKTRVAANCDWHYPAMIIHPMLELFVQDMLASDPLYVIDESHYLLEPTLEQFNPVYKNRLRSCVIEESFERPILAQLPDRQIGFCLAYNYFNYRPFEIIKVYLNEIYEKLLPGGVLAMTFYDCDRYQAMQAVEQCITYYTPGTLVRGWAKYLGFEEIFCHQDNGARVWVEFRKPGQSSSLRGGQALAKILPKPVANSK